MRTDYFEVDDVQVSKESYLEQYQAIHDLYTWKQVWHSDCFENQEANLQAMLEDYTAFLLE